MNLGEFHPIPSGCTSPIIQCITFLGFGLPECFHVFAESDTFHVFEGIDFVISTAVLLNCQFA